MKLGKIMLSVGLVSVMLMGCGTANNDRFANDTNRPIGVNYTDNNRHADNYTYNDGYRNVGVRNGMNGTMNTTTRGTKYRDAKDIADKVADLPEVDRAHVVVTDHTAYVGVRLSGTETNRMDRHLEDRIDKIVRDTDRSVNNVHISERPEFFQHLTSLRGGTLTNDFYNMVDRIFPNNRVVR
ncbi:YhcN/YlaJ family sporulation lipoprotein [Bacillus sp. FJAT-50079]|uniref:YhcN/YlaJ family sporulation lipoprotein n=1 Tax=Bacillus sp. FJAT-50079 TaxID=2833577 RepID=UPI001BC9124A|nr:YhcN/YlaJ family sporulation lipoprotein [Bacillus sp. FJAT-50079]MBS4208699.1 YhcN/YlaJ family sporulation lipoprotein [Bacillus sp. FJAT-50079]